MERVAYKKLRETGNSLAVLWSRLCTFIAEGAGSVLDQGTKVSQASWCNQKKKEEEEGEEKEKELKQLRLRSLDPHVSSGRLSIIWVIVRSG